MCFGHSILKFHIPTFLLETPFDALFVVPDGLNNHIFWNIAHCVATQQLLHYYLTGNDFRVDQKWVELYKKGTFPCFDEEEEDVENLAFILKETSKLLASDYDKGYFAEYKTYSTSFRLELKNIENAIIYNNIHEGIHLGHVMAKRKILLG